MESERPDYLEPYEKLIPIRILGRELEVPENNTALRVFQYLELEKKALRVDYRDFCWNQECNKCRISFRKPGDPAVKEGLGCTVKITPYMDLVQLPPAVRPVAPSGGQTGQSTTEYILTLAATFGLVLAIVEFGRRLAYAGYLRAAVRLLLPYP